jgi:hypothetical protein
MWFRQAQPPGFGQGGFGQRRALLGSTTGAPSATKEAKKILIDFPLVFLGELRGEKGLQFLPVEGFHPSNLPVFQSSTLPVSSA